MSALPKSRTYGAYAALWIGLFLAWPLWREFREPNYAVWNFILLLILVGLPVGAFFGIRYLQKNEVEVGEARFTKNDEEGR